MENYLRISQLIMNMPLKVASMWSEQVLGNRKGSYVHRAFTG